jgi:hyperosmotically inducible protein
MRTLLPLILSSAVAGCNPYMMAATAVTQTYDVATDERSVSTQASDAKIEGEIKANLLASPVVGTDSISVFCRRGVVVLAGVVQPGSNAGRAAVEIARATPGVWRVETFWVAADPSRLGDVEIEAKLKAAFIADPNVDSSRVTYGVYGGHVVLVGIVPTQAQVDAFVADAQSVPGVLSVRSYIQTES